MDTYEGIRNVDSMISFFEREKLAAKTELVSWRIMGVGLKEGGLIQRPPFSWLPRSQLIANLLRLERH